ncbi:MAG: sulfite exporter TauE/SafE family protein [bacterium]|nr:sulfite exporter TauE/SafE family protein [bacterium]
MTLSVLLVAVGFVGATLAGLVGVGGGIVLVPLLITVPGWLGLPGFDLARVAGMTSVQVLVASALALGIHARKAGFHLQVAVPMAIASAAGATLGGLASGAIAPGVLEVVFATLCLLGGVLMLVPASGDHDESDAIPATFSRPIAVAMAAAVGALSGLVGAGGAFLLVPLMRTGLGLPLRVVVSTSLVTVAAAALFGTLGKSLTGQVDLASAAWLVVGTLAGAPLGAVLSHRFRVATLRTLLAGVILLSAARLWMTILRCA